MRTLSRDATFPAIDLDPLRAILGRARDAAVTFVAEPASARPLAAMRIGVAFVLLLQALAIAPHLVDFFGMHGFMQSALVDAVVAHELPRVSWLARALAPFGIAETTALAICFCAYVASLHFLMLGWRTRIAAAAAWLLHLTLKTSGNLSAYGVFEFATIALFYCFCFPSGDAWSVDSRRESRPPTPAARLGLRLLQLHLCVVYLSSGIEKASGEQWRNGEAIWRAIMRPAFEPFDLSWLAAHSWIAMLATWATLAVECGYVLMIWPRRTRRMWALATIGMHAGIACLLGLWAFSGVMITLNTAAFVISASPKCPYPPAPREHTLR
jgi:hypothetical protein